ncbi:DUF1554 domain-containing protein [Turneriella parva]|uniref:DUF1554 domain-containing protein n=1 Tax=Turneriella parva (strain ATCC BAA-1111 / DSM 21527 / NCTC 11395 / H) TaxID=869212 RepID=I4B674_TURPD|nr:DUF1554 domain-containing protein [Turneriella parva]AFM12781.1 protein of unknown function DUF1554 [Turneriella parva DSM 21527]
MRSYQQSFIAMVLAFALACAAGCNNYGLADQLESPGKTDGGSGFNLVNTMFVTQTTFNGNLGGVAGADNLCRNDAANPMGSGNGVWKALISANAQRIACTTSNCSGSGAAEHLDWVLKSNTTYYRPDKTVLGSTDANGLFTAPLVATVGTGSAVTFTGLTADWALSGDTCNAWTDQSVGSFNGLTGLSNQTNQQWFSNTANSCDVPTKALYCVQQ